MTALFSSVIPTFPPSKQREDNYLSFHRLGKMMSMNITSKERDGKINKSRGIVECFSLVGQEHESIKCIETRKYCYSRKDVGHSRTEFLLLWL